jgi:hypothetical protein
MTGATSYTTGAVMATTTDQPGPALSDPPPSPERSTRDQTTSPGNNRIPLAITAAANETNTRGQDVVDAGVRKWLRRLRGCLCYIPRGILSSAIEQANLAAGQSSIQVVGQTRLTGGWSTGVFIEELLSQSIVPRSISAADTGKTITPPGHDGKPASMRAGTYQGTKLPLTQMAQRIEARYVTSTAWEALAHSKPDLPRTLTSLDSRPAFRFNPMPNQPSCTPSQSQVATSIPHTWISYPKPIK